jgi:predicted dehydrogenase
MNFLVIGLGSMGKRRVRNLIALGCKHIAGFDIRKDRRSHVNDKYNIPIFDDFDLAIRKFNPDAFIISTPPDLHMKYAYYAFDKGIHCFIEGSVVDADKILELSKKLENTDIVIVPSCTMRFYSGPMKIKELVNNGVIGKPLNYNYQTGQYLPDWHPWEGIEEFYVSKTETGGCREIVPFELTWLNDIFGEPKPLACVKKKLTDMSAPIDDIYHCLLNHPNELIGNLTVEVISRPKATREFRLIGSEGEIVFNGDDNMVKYINTSMDDWEEIYFETGTIEKQYINPEEPYIQEMSEFMSAITEKNSALFSNSLYDDYKILQNLYELERLSERDNS